MSHDTKDYANFPVVFQISIIFLFVSIAKHYLSPFEHLLPLELFSDVSLHCLLGKKRLTAKKIGL